MVWLIFEIGVQLADVLYTYRIIIHGFSTRLTAEEAELLEKQSGIVSVLPELRYELHTTRTPEFLGITFSRNEAIFPTSDKISRVVIDLIDTGVWPEIKSYDDKGYEASMGQPIDERVESRSPRDDSGHGTHTSTTAAGSAVPGASLFGYASGTARGMATQARVATYKACWFGGCYSSDIIAAMDKAVEDGVNILSLSIGGTRYHNYYTDAMAIGAFSAVAKGIFMSGSAGNGGPAKGSLSHNAPWITTVGAGTLDRDFLAYVRLGNRKKYRGISIHAAPSLSSGLLPLVYAGNASNSIDGDVCSLDSLIPGKVAGKIVVCDKGITYNAEKSAVVKKAGGVGMILANTKAYGEEVVAESYLLPTVVVGHKASDAIKRYIASHDNPKATFDLGKTQLGVEPSPVVAAFSYRGPNLISPTVLKLDLIAPGVNILAGWSGAVPPSGFYEDTRRVSFNIISAVKSALMTTSYTTYKNGKPLKDIATRNAATPFDYGAGHVDPVAALDPGLVYDLCVEDYLSFLCALNYTTTDIKILTHIDFTCDSSKNYRAGDLNYPSFAVSLNTSSGNRGAGTKIYTRTLTNVGTPGTYKVSVSALSPSVKIWVEPKSLSFARAYEKKMYTIRGCSGSSADPRLLIRCLEMH
ncbi:hypothetical protein ACE6H2_004307 [Prunus campanulata]